MSQNKKIVVVGAGLVGSLLATMLVKKGFAVDVFEKRADPRAKSTLAGRSINLALSHRGIGALKMAGVYEQIAPQLIPMKGRKLHDVDGQLGFQPYGKEGQFINSVSRNDLNLCLINEAENHGVTFHFEHVCQEVNYAHSELTFDYRRTTVNAEGEVIFGTDGAFSAIRSSFQKTDRFNYSQHYIEHGYKELHMPPKAGDFAMEPNFLHIWPRGKYMLIALPNPDKTFTCTLFFPFEGSPSFSDLTTPEKVEQFFKKEFPDVADLIPDYKEQFESNPTSSLVTVKCFPWLKNRTFIIGDACHAIVPFYGQGMNAGFEDCRLLMEMAEAARFDWDQVLTAFQATRKKDADAIADLALKNFVEMRDWVGDDKFLLRKKIEAKLHEAYPDKWIPQYTMVTFTDIPYSEAQARGNKQDRIMDELLDVDQLPDEERIDLSAIVAKLQ
jgi:kynurenine 3-monooxygenase